MSKLKMKISLSSIDPCPPLRAKRSDKAGHKDRSKDRSKTYLAFFLLRTAIRAWSRMTGFENSLK